MEVEEEENNQANQQNIHPNNPIDTSRSSIDNSSNEKDYPYLFLLLMQAFVYFEIIVCENQRFCIMYWN